MKSKVASNKCGKDLKISFTLQPPTDGINLTQVATFKRLNIYDSDDRYAREIREKPTFPKNKHLI